MRHRCIGVAQYGRDKLLLKNAGAGPHGSLPIAERIPRQADSRSKIVLVRNKERLTQRWSAIEDTLHARCPAISLTGNRREFMPQADRERQPGSQLDVVLDKPAEHILLVAELRIVDLRQNLRRRARHEISYAWEHDRPHIVPVVLRIREIVLENAAKLERMRSPQVADIIGKFKDAVREPPRCLDEDAIGGRYGRARDIPNAGQISAREDGQLQDWNIPEIRRSKVAKCPVDAGAGFIDPARRYDPCQGQLEILVASVLGGSVNAELPRAHHVRLIENVAAIQRVLVAELSIDPPQHVIFGRWLHGIIDELCSAVAVIGSVRQRIKIHHRLYARMDSNELFNSIDRQIALVRAPIGNGCVIGEAEPLPQAFIAGEEEQLIFLHR